MASAATMLSRRILARGVSLARLGAGGALCVAGGALALERQAVLCHAKSLSTAAATPSPTALTLYQYEICPFCNKVKSVLDYLDVPYATIDVNPLTKSELKFSADYKKVPVLLTSAGEQVNDSAAILDRVLALLEAEGRAPKGELERLSNDEALKWAQWADKELAVYIYPNITRNYSESFDAFAYIEDVPHFSMLDKLANRYLGALAMVFAQGKIKKKYGIVDERAEMFAKLTVWTDALGDRPFCGGDKPSLADLSVFGCIRAIKGTATHKDIMSNTAIGPWYRRMEDAVGVSSRTSRT